MDRARTERLLRLVLVVSGVALLCALPAAVMPSDWMRAIHGRAFGEPLPDRRIVEYLTRTLSGMYAALGGITLFLATDVRRFAPVVACKSAVGVAFGAGVLWLDLIVGMPWWWSAAEGPGIVLICGTALVLAVRVLRAHAGV